MSQDTMTYLSRLVRPEVDCIPHDDFLHAPLGYLPAEPDESHRPPVIFDPSLLDWRGWVYALWEDTGRFEITYIGATRRRLRDRLAEHERQNSLLSQRRAFVLAVSGWRIANHASMWALERGLIELLRPTHNRQYLEAAL